MMEKRPIAVYVLTLCLLFVGVGALYGGYTLLADPTGGLIGMPLSYLNGSIFADFGVPGLFLFIVFGLGSLLALAVLWLRPAVGLFTQVTALTHEHWSWTLTLLLGVLLIVWIVIQYGVIQQFHPLQPIIAGIGLLIVMLDLLPATRRYYHE